MNTPTSTGHSGHERHGKPSPPPAKLNAAPDETGRDDASGYGGASLVGSNVSGLEDTADAQPGTTHRAPDDASRAADATGMGTHTPAGVSTIGSGTTGLNNYSPGSDLGAGRDALRRASGGERASAGPSDAERSSRNDGNSLDV